MNLEWVQQRLERWYGRVDRRLGGWLTLIVRTGIAFDRDEGPLTARSIAYYALFSVFPLLLIFIVVASSVLASDEVYESVMNLVVQYMPVAEDLVEANIEQMLAVRETTGLVALIGLVWSASGVFSAIYRAVNRAWGTPKSRLFWSEKLYGLALILVLGTLFLVSLAFSTALSLARAWQMRVLGWQPGAMAGWLSTLVPTVLAVGAFTLMYRTMPRPAVKWRDVWLGGLLAGLIWEAGTQIFTWYMANFAEYNAIYGSVAAIIVFLLWAYLSAQIVLLGAEFTAEYTRWRQAGRPLETRPLREWLSETLPETGQKEIE